MKGERLQSLPDTCTKTLLSLYFISLLFPERGREKGKRVRKKKKAKTERHREERAEIKPSRCEFCHLLKKKKNVISLLCLEG